jgi:hypothetical protein
MTPTGDLTSREDLEGAVALAELRVFGGIAEAW